MATKKKESTMKTVGVKNTAVITDGCNPELVKGAFFDGVFQIPVINANGSMQKKKCFFLNRAYIKKTIIDDI